VTSQLKNQVQEAVVMDAAVMGRSKALKVWDMNSSVSSSRRYADFVVGQMEYMATPAAKKAH
jgi:site-specific recombinase XerC